MCSEILQVYRVRRDYADLFSKEIILEYMSIEKFLKENSHTGRLKRVQINLFYSTHLWLLNSAMTVLFQDYF